MLRFALLVPITAVGFVLLAARYGGIGQSAGGARVRRARARELIAYARARRSWRSRCAL